MRARLAGNGGVNPPEAVAALVDSLADPCTRETPDGGAEMLPNHPDALKAAGAAGATTATPSAAAEAPKRKRRTKAEMEAARAAEADGVTPEQNAAIERVCAKLETEDAARAARVLPAPTEISLLIEIRDLLVAIERAR